LKIWFPKVLKKFLSECHCSPIASSVGSGRMFENTSCRGDYHVFYCGCRFVTLAVAFIANILLVPTHRHDVIILCVSRGLHGSTKCIRLHRFCGRGCRCIIIIIVILLLLLLQTPYRDWVVGNSRTHIVGV